MKNFMRLKSSKNLPERKISDRESGGHPPRTFHGHENHIIPVKFLLVIKHRYVGGTYGSADAFRDLRG